MNFLRTSLLTGLLLCGIASGRGADLSIFEGLSGQDLAAAVRTQFSPANIPSALPVGGIFPDDWPDSWWPARWPCDGSRIALIVPEQWSRTPIFDLYNMIAGDDNFVGLRSDYPPGNVELVYHASDGWTTGIMTLSGYPTNAWQPADDRRGDLARRLMYVALMYPHTLWSGRGAMFMADGEWPLLNTYARDLLAEWNDIDPIDEREMSESAGIAVTQGNENPFLLIPDLFSYLWGENAGTGFVPDDKRERIPLRGSYSRSADKIVDLYSPYVDSDAEWAIDGRPVTEDVIDLQNVSLGVHILTYKTARDYGKLKITLTQ